MMVFFAHIIRWFCKMWQVQNIAGIFTFLKICEDWSYLTSTRAKKKHWSNTCSFFLTISFLYSIFLLQPDACMIQQYIHDSQRALISKICSIFHDIYLPKYTNFKNLSRLAVICACKEAYSCNGWRHKRWICFYHYVSHILTENESCLPQDCQPNERPIEESCKQDEKLQYWMCCKILRKMWMESGDSAWSEEKFCSRHKCL